MYDDSYNNDLSEHDSDLLEAEADLLLGEDFDDGEGISDDLDAPHAHSKKSHAAGDDELDDLDGFEDDLDAFDFHDDLGDEIDTEM
jgi:hypothetical protein